MNIVVSDIFDISESSCRSHYINMSTTKGSREIQTFVRFLLLGELVGHAVCQGTKAANIQIGLK